jgi:hypothetical protein
MKLFSEVMMLIAPGYVIRRKGGKDEKYVLHHYYLAALSTWDKNVTAGIRAKYKGSLSGTSRASISS